MDEEQAGSETYGTLRQRARGRRDSIGRNLPKLLGLLVLGLAAGPVLGLAAETAQVDARLDQLFGEHETYRNFLHELQMAVSEHARGRVAAMVSYPLRTRINGQWVRLQTPAQFLAHYDALLTPKVQEAITRQAYEDLFSNSQGVMIGRGEVWYSGVCQDHNCSSRSLRIIAFNP
jgi:hypothetical protein